MHAPRVSVIIPAWNEEESIRKVVEAIPQQYVDEILVIDGGSTDSTPLFAEQAGARVMIERQRGYGRACATGAEGARNDILIFLDADGADDPRYIPDLLAPLTHTGADLALGSRLAGIMEPGAMPWHQKTGNRLSAGMINALYGCALTDLSPMRAVRKSMLKTLSMQEMTYGWPTEMIVKAAKRGWKMVEVPVDYRARLGGRSKISGTWKGSLLATFYIFKVIGRYARRGSGN
jgi:glycosyltransferase involved in cell wall biosynthesis